jgi:YHS domain-containing protein
LKENDMKSWIFWGICAVVVLVGAFLVVKKVSPVGWGLWGNYNTSSGIALHGYDPVAYHKSQTATKGSNEFALDWGGATWQFSSAENKSLFSADPDVYAPQFGGFCSFAVSKGFTADISPDAWHIHDGKLYVFAERNVRDNWVMSLGEGSLEKSAANWANH